MCPEPYSEQEPVQIRISADMMHRIGLAFWYTYSAIRSDIEDAAQNFPEEYNEEYSDFQWAEICADFLDLHGRDQEAVDLFYQMPLLQQEELMRTFSF